MRLSETGAARMRGFGIDLDNLRRARAPLCRACLDWSERRSRLGGSLGRAILGRIEDLGWAARARPTRVVSFTPRGQRAFDDLVAGLRG